jgi:hypothetical protein
MPNFFVPFADSPGQAERAYSGFRQQNQYPTVGNSRIFKISYDYRGKLLTAEVGKDFSGFPEPVGAVLAIVESSNLVTIHTQLRGGLSATPILVSPNKITERVYFDDFPK